MMNGYYELLGLDETATDEELQERYEQLREKYKEERWQDGAAGNEAAKMLTKIEVAYKEIVAFRKENKDRKEGGNAFEEIAALLKQDKVSEAQARLDEFNERGAEWHYLQAVVFFKKNWTNESKKQLEIAMQIDPENTKYREAYGKLNARANAQQQAAQNPYTGQGQTQNNGQGENYRPEEQMGGNACSDCVSCCYTYLCVDCLFSLCCGCR